MALKASIFKAELTVSDTDRHYYATHNLTIARHPSETNERMMLRLAAFAVHASDSLSFGKGISTDDEPDLWHVEPNSDITLWLDLGLPSTDRIRKACAKAITVSLWAYGSDRAFQPWWQKNESALQRFSHLNITRIDPAQSQTLAELAAPNMAIQAMISDGDIHLTIDNSSLSLTPQSIKST